MFGIQSTDLADKQLLRRFNKGVRFLLYVVHNHSSYVWIVPLKENIGISIVDTLKENSWWSSKSNKKWFNKSCEL